MYSLDKYKVIDYLMEKEFGRLKKLMKRKRMDCAFLKNKKIETLISLSKMDNFDDYIKDILIISNELKQEIEVVERSNSDNEYYEELIQEQKDFSNYSIQLSKRDKIESVLANIKNKNKNSFELSQKEKKIINDFLYNEVRKHFLTKHTTPSNLKDFKSGYFNMEKYINSSQLIQKFDSLKIELSVSNIDFNDFYILKDYRDKIKSDLEIIKAGKNKKFLNFKISEKSRLHKRKIKKLCVKIKEYNKENVSF